MEKVKEDDGAKEEERPLMQEFKAGEAGGGEDRPKPIRGGAVEPEEWYVRYGPGTGFGCLLVDAKNAFCKQFRYLTLHE